LLDSWISCIFIKRVKEFRTKSTTFTLVKLTFYFKGFWFSFVWNDSHYKDF
jgi:hypothetical protein